MGYYAEKGKEFELFQGQYKIKLLFGDKLSYGEGDLKPFQITYFCKSHGKTYRIRKSNDKFICGEYEIDETDIDDVDDIIGIGAGLEITAEDLDLMFGDWEEFSKKLKPITEENVDWLVKEVPQLNEPLIMEMYWYSNKSFSQLMTDIADEYNNLTGNANKKFRRALKDKIDGAFKAYELEKNGTRRAVQRGDVWKIAMPVGVGSVSNGYRYVVIVSRELHANNSRTVNVVNITSAVDHKTGIRKPIKEEWQLEMTNADMEEGALAHDSYVNIADLFTVDKLQLETRIGKVKDEFLKKVVGRVAEQIAVFDEPIEINFGDEEE